ncbi:MAG: LysR family transcriptional regulator [Acidovorax temperans]|uniref:LysR family transcriptional regulator n=1 Tax=Acidovorax temperans TaxID=80878 RepID=UPI003919ADD2
MDLRGFDLNLLIVFNALAQHRSVTRAGESIGLSQPAMSAALARLRLLLGDPLFVKTGPEMRPTPRAAQLVAPVRQALEIVKGEVLLTQAFDPATSTRTFSILTPDIGESNHIPRLLSLLSAEAPGVNIKVLSMPRHAAFEALEAGVVDLAVGYFPDLQREGLFVQRLFRNEHFCMVRRDHPVIGEKLSLKQFMAADHATVRPEGREHVFEHYLHARGIQPRVRLEVAHFMSLLPIISTSDLIATVPRDLAEVCVRYGNIRMLPTPFKVPAIEIHQFWHPRVHKDIAHQWLRGAMRRLFPDGNP